MTTLTEWLNDPMSCGEGSTREGEMESVLRRLAEEHRPVHPKFMVPKDGWAETLAMLDFRLVFEDPEQFVEQESEWEECETCPDTAGWPCPTVKTMCELLGCEPDTPGEAA